MSTEPVLNTGLERFLPFVSKGKVREIWKLDADELLFVATDRISAYDVVLANGVPDKGRLSAVMLCHPRVKD